MGSAAVRESWGEDPFVRRPGFGDAVGVDNPVALLALALVAVFVAIPLILGIAQAVSAREAWAPFERRGNGRDGVLVPGRYFEVLRAPRESARTRLGLVARWGFWVALTVVLGGGTAYAFLR
jgi:hypothetical protein